jgi:hypothetical protein
MDTKHKENCMNRRERVSVLIGGVLLLVAATGCPIVIPVPESVLQGTWELTGDLVSPDVSNFLITFDKEGQIAKITYDINNATITVDSGSLLQSSSDVNGDAVSITATWGNGSTLVFDGTLNNAQTQAEGSTGFRLVISASITIDIPTGPATLTKQ